MTTTDQMVGDDVTLSMARSIWMPSYQPLRPAIVSATSANRALLWCDLRIKTTDAKAQIHEDALAESGELHQFLGRVSITRNRGS